VRAVPNKAGNVDSVSWAHVGSIESRRSAASITVAALRPRRMRASAELLTLAFRVENARHPFQEPGGKPLASPRLARVVGVAAPEAARPAIPASLLENRSAHGSRPGVADGIWRCSTTARARIREAPACSAATSVAELTWPGSCQSQRAVPIAASIRRLRIGTSTDTQR